MATWKLPGPTLGWNAKRANSAYSDDDHYSVKPYNLDKNLFADEGSPVSLLIEQTATHARTLPGGKIKWLVINCHGLYAPTCTDYPADMKFRSNDNLGFDPAPPKQICPPTGGYALIIGNKFGNANVQRFSALKNLVEGVYLCVCGASAVSRPGHKIQGDGNLFCSALAKNINGFVWASPDLQPNNDPSGYAKNTVDDLSGRCYVYLSDGSNMLLKTMPKVEDQ